MHADQELHFFDVVYRPDLFGFWPKTVFARVRQQIADLTFEDGIDGLDRCSLVLEHAQMLQDNSRYLNLFRNRIRDRHTLFGEITPSYATLNLDGFKAIRSAHDNVKVVFILRDPVARLISSVRHGKRLLGENATAEDIMEGLNDPAQVARCGYDQTLKSLDEVFAPEEIFITFIENLFEDSFAGEFGAFVGLDGLKTDRNDMINVSPSVGLLDTDQTKSLRSRLDPVYEYCRDRFGDRLPSSWLP